MPQAGLLELVAHGIQDIFLIGNPQLTFFKTVYKRHTNFSIELVEVNINRSAEFNNISSFIIKNGDAINKCYLEIELPKEKKSEKPRFNQTKK